MNGLLLTPLRRVPTPKGDVLHGLRLGDPGFAGFGEVYASIVLQGLVKGWKRHRRMTLNLVCYAGAVRVVVRGGIDSDSPGIDVVLSPDSAERFQRLTIPPGLWVGFQGIGPGENVMLNIASLTHDPAEADTCELDAFRWPDPT